MSPRTAAALLIAAPPASAADDAIEPHHCWASRAVNWANIHRSQLYAVTIIACNTASINYYHNLPATPGVLMTFVSVGLRHTHSSVIGLLHVGRFYDHATAHLATERPVPCLSVRLSLGTCRSCVQMADSVVNQTGVYKIYSVAYLSTKPNYDTMKRSTFEWALEELTHRRLNLAHGADPPEKLRKNKSCSEETIRSRDLDPLQNCFPIILKKKSHVGLISTVFVGKSPRCRIVWDNCRSTVKRKKRRLSTTTMSITSLTKRLINEANSWLQGRHAGIDG